MCTARSEGMQAAHSSRSVSSGRQRSQRSTVGELRSPQISPGQQGSFPSGGGSGGQQQLDSLHMLSQSHGSESSLQRNPLTASTLNTTTVSSSGVPGAQGNAPTLTSRASPHVFSPDGLTLTSVEQLTATNAAGGGTGVVATGMRSGSTPHTTSTQGPLANAHNTTLPAIQHRQPSQRNAAAKLCQDMELALADMHVRHAPAHLCRQPTDAITGH